MCVQFWGPDVGVASSIAFLGKVFCKNVLYGKRRGPFPGSTIASISRRIFETKQLPVGREGMKIPRSTVGQHGEAHEETVAISQAFQVFDDLLS